MNMSGFERGMINPSAMISPNAVIGQNVTIGAHTIIYDNVHIGDNSIIGPHCILGEPAAEYYSQMDYQNPPLSISERAIIRSGSIIYSGSVIGPDFETGHRVCVREKTKIGKNCRIGTLSDIQGDCILGDYVRIHGNVQVGQKSKIGNFVWVYPYTVLTNDPYPPSNIIMGVEIGDYSVIATKSVLLPGIKIGKDSLVGAMSLVRHDVPDETVVIGNPAKNLGSIHHIFNTQPGMEGNQMYPWREHFERGMPWQGIGYQQWKLMLQKKDHNV